MKLKSWIAKYQTILRYLFVSGMTAVIESIIGILCMQCLRMSEVPANTIGIFIGSVIHYLCVTRGVFQSKVNWKTVAVYAGTFVMGMLIQNFVVWGVVHLIGDALHENLRYLTAKACSLVISFFIMYFVRKLGYQKVSGKKE